MINNIINDLEKRKIHFEEYKTILTLLHHFDLIKIFLDSCLADDQKSKLKNDLKNNDFQYLDKILIDFVETYNLLIFDFEMYLDNELTYFYDVKTKSFSQHLLSINIDPRSLISF